MATASVSDEENLSEGESYVSDESGSDEYSDEETDVQREPCKYYNRGGCRTGNRCPYLHVCKYALKGNCRNGSECKLNHPGGGKSSSGGSSRALDRSASPDVKLTDGRCYQWQLDDGSGWVDVDNNHIIEAQYSLPHTKSIKIYNTPFGAVSIDFNRMRVYGKRLKVRRLDDGNTVWIWYCTLSHKWIKYGEKDAKGNPCPVKSSDIEEKFQSNPSSSFTFSKGAETFEIKFTEMRQVGQKRKRRVTRRPLYQQQQAGAAVAQAVPALQSLHLGTKPQWQFEGDSGAWHEFRHRKGTPTECSVTSNDIEMKYQQNPHGKMIFKVKGHSYELDFGVYFSRSTENEDETSYWRQETPVNGKYYEWQLSDRHRWLQIDNDHVIETHYCQPGAKGITINTSHGSVFIDFDKMQTLNTALKVQRLSLLPQGQTEDVGWYFRDDQLWCEYGSQGLSPLTSSVSSKDVEHQFSLNPRGTFSFTVGSTSYRLDFSTMTQTNCITGMCRNVRRRPKFTSNTGSFYPVSVLPTASSSAAMTQTNSITGLRRNVPRLPKLTSNAGSFYSASVLPTASFSQLTDGGFKWEFMGEEGEWTEYQAHICSLDSSAIETQYQLNPQGQLHFKTKRFSYTLDFSGMCQVNNKIGTTRAVRRTAVSGSQQNSRSGTVPRWQFKDIGGIWKDYSKGQCSVSSQDIELQYQQNPSGTMTFTTKNFSYELNFSAMTQMNLSTVTTRPVRRLDQ